MTTSSRTAGHRLHRASWLLATLALPWSSAQAVLVDEVSSVCTDSLGGIVLIEPSSNAGLSSCHFSMSNSEHVASGAAAVQIKVADRKVGVVSSANASLQLLDTVGGMTVVQSAGHAKLTDSFGAVAKDAAGNAVTAGYMDVDVLATGTMSFSGSGEGLNGSSSARIHYTFELQYGGTVAKSFQLTAPGTQPLSARLSHRIEWFAGDKIWLSMEVDAATNAFLGGSGTADAKVDFGNSLDWLGVRNVTDLNGVPVASYSMVSADSGVDWGVYTPAVPEPASWGLLLAGLGLTLGVVRRQRRA